MAKFKLVFEVRDMNLPDQGALAMESPDRLVHETSQIVIEIDETALLTDIPDRVRKFLSSSLDLNSDIAVHIDMAQASFVREHFETACLVMARASAIKILEHLKSKVPA